MKNKKIAVLVKYYNGEINPFDGAALESALCQTDCDITVVTMSPKSHAEALAGLTRLGVKAVLVSDGLYAGSDTLVTGRILAEVVKRLSPDLVFCGRKSVNGDTGQVPPMIAERLGYAFYPQAMGIDGEEITLRDGSKVTPEKGSVITFEKIATLRFPSIFSKKGEVTVVTNADLGFNGEEVGLIGSPTQVIRTYENSVDRRSCKFVEANALDFLIKESLKKERTSRNIARKTGLKVCCTEKAKGFAERVSDSVTVLSEEKLCAAEIERLSPDAVLFDDGEESKQLAARLAVRLNAGLCADCVSISEDGGRAVLTRPALSGSVTADICCKGLALATVKTEGSSSDVIFCIGYGAVHKIDGIKRLAKKYGAEVCATRVAVDKGFMPYGAQVGLTGRTVNSKVYVLFGASGAVQHTCAISGADTVIAVNKDKNARIFDYADYGIAEDIENVGL